MTNERIESYVKTLARFALEQVQWNDREISYCEDSLPENHPDRLKPVALSEEAKHTIRETMRPTVEEVCERGPDRPVDWDQDDAVVNAQDPRGRSIPTTSSGSTNLIVVLGAYFPITRDPPNGKIVLYEKKIAGYFWHVVLGLLSKHSINAYQLSRLADATALEIASHELFHYKSDLTTIFFGTTRSGKQGNEEALAVAASYDALKWNLNRWAGDLVAPSQTVALRKAFLDKIYNYTLPGYCDWSKYGSNSTFVDGVRKHWLPPGVVKYGPLSPSYSFQAGTMWQRHICDHLWYDFAQVSHFQAEDWTESISTVSISIE